MTQRKKKKAKKPGTQLVIAGVSIASLLEYIGIFAGAIVIAFVAQAFLIKPFQIPSESMVPTIDPGDRILINRLSYRFGPVQRGDIIVFKSPMNPDVDFVKRVIAVGGETIEVKRGTVLVNGEPQVENYLNGADISNFPLTSIPEGNVFVMGDNRGDSGDARFWNPHWLPEENILGKAFATYWPPGRIGTFN
ncbi:MAG: signal peptidase I [Thermoleophilia bacterium]